MIGRAGVKFPVNSCGCWLVCRLLMAFILCGFTSKIYAASLDSTLVCDDAAKQASEASGVPLKVLQALTRTETGRKTSVGFGPWPWTVNMEGKGVWFETEEAARVYVFKHFKRGARSFDVGCFQINYRWHHQEFSSIQEMFNPRENALYAARFLQQLFKEFGSWNEAAGAFHSRNKAHATNYKARFQKHLASVRKSNLKKQNVQPQETASQPNNTYPFLFGSGRALSAGSLVRLSSENSNLEFVPIQTSQGFLR